MRRDGGRAEPMMRIGLLEIDPATRRVCLEGQAIDLSRREFAVLEALARRPDHIVSRGAIEEAIYGWQEEVGSNRSEEHTSELQSLMRISYAVFCLKKKTEYCQDKNYTKSTK